MLAAIFLLMISGVYLAPLASAAQFSCAEEIRKLMGDSMVMTEDQLNARRRERMSKSKLIFGQANYHANMGPSSKRELHQWDLSLRFENAYGKNLSSGITQTLVAQDLIPEFLQNILATKAEVFIEKEILFLEKLIQTMEVEIRNGTMDFVSRSEYPSLLKADGTSKIAITSPRIEAPVLIDEEEIKKLDLKNIFMLLIEQYSKHQENIMQADIPELLLKLRNVSELKTESLKGANYNFDLNRLGVSKGEASSLTTRRRHYVDQYEEGLESIDGHQALLSDGVHSYDLKQLLRAEVGESTRGVEPMIGWFFELKSWEILEGPQPKLKLKVFHDFASPQSYVSMASRPSHLKGNVEIELPLKKQGGQLVIDAEAVAKKAHKLRGLDSPGRYTGSHIFRNVEAEFIETRNADNTLEYYVQLTFDKPEQSVDEFSLNILLNDVNDKDNFEILTNGVVKHYNAEKQKPSYTQLPDGRLQMKSKMTYIDLNRTPDKELVIKEIRFHGAKSHILTSLEPKHYKIQGGRAPQEPKKASFFGNSFDEGGKTKFEFEMGKFIPIRMKFKGDRELFNSNAVGAKLIHAEKTEFSMINLHEHMAWVKYLDDTGEWEVSFSIYSSPNNGIVQWIDEAQTIPGSHFQGVKFYREDMNGESIEVMQEFTAISHFRKKRED